MLKMEILNNLMILKKKIEKSKKHIASNQIKLDIKKFFESDWILNQGDIRKCNTDIHDNIDSLVNELYLFGSKQYFEKSSALKIIRKIEGELEKIKIDNIKKGVVFKEDFKEKIFELVSNLGHQEVVKYLKKAEGDIKKDPEESCSNSRKAIEEVFRLSREKAENKQIHNGTLGDHSARLESMKRLSQVEKRFFNSGLYSFLSEKGSHSNKEKKDEFDSLFGFMNVIIAIDYLYKKKVYY